MYVSDVSFCFEFKACGLEVACEASVSVLLAAHSCQLLRLNACYAGEAQGAVFFVFFSRTETCCVVDSLK